MYSQPHPKWTVLLLHYLHRTNKVETDAVCSTNLSLNIRHGPRSLHKHGMVDRDRKVSVIILEALVGQVSSFAQVQSSSNAIALLLLFYAPQEETSNNWRQNATGNVHLPRSPPE